MEYSARSVRATVIVLIAIGSVLLAITVGLALMSYSAGAFVAGAGCVVFYVIALFTRMALALMAPIKRRQRRRLTPGETIRFRNKRYFFTPASTIGAAGLLALPASFLGLEIGLWAVVVFVSAVILGWLAFVLAVPPRGGRRFYELTAKELIVRTSEERHVIPWCEVEYLCHRPPTQTQEGAFVVTYTTHREFLELFLRHRGPRIYGGRQPPGPGRRRLEVLRRRAVRGGDGLIVVQGVHRQQTLSKLIIDQCHGHIGRALRADFDRVGELDYGDFRLTRDGVRAPDGFLRWRTNWQFVRSHGKDGVELTITASNDQRINGWVPEETIALDLLDKLARQQRLQGK